MSGKLTAERVSEIWDARKTLAGSLALYQELQTMPALIAEQAEEIRKLKAERSQLAWALDMADLGEGTRLNQQEATRWFEIVLMAGEIVESEKGA